MTDPAQQKPITEFVHDISAMRDGAGVHLIEIRPATDDPRLKFRIQQSSFSGALAKDFKESEVLDAICNTMRMCLSYYQQLLAHAVARETSNIIISDAGIEIVNPAITPKAKQ